jgi:hypothetical protein
MDSKKLAVAVRELKGTLGDIADCPNAAVSDFDNEINEVRGLLSVLANMIEGMPADRAFGSPGDWGYGTAIGDALAGRG